MISTKSKLLLASTALVAVSGVAHAGDIDVAAAGITDGSTGTVSTLTHTDADTDTTINSGDTVTVPGAITFGADESINVAADVDGITFDVDANITGAAGQSAALVIFNGVNSTINVSSTATLDSTNNADVLSIVGAGNTVNVNGTLTAGTGNGITVADVDGTSITVSSTGDAGEIDASALTGTNALTLSVAGTAAAVTTGAGADSVTVSGSLTGAVDLAAGDDTMTVTGDVLAVDLGTGTNSLTITGGTTGAITADGTDTITISGDDVDIGGLINGATGTSATIVITGGSTMASQTEIDGITGAGTDDTLTVNSGWVNSSAAITNVNDINVNGGDVTLASVVGANNLVVADGAVLTSGAASFDTSITVAGEATFSGAVTSGADTAVTGILNLDAAATVGDLMISGNGSVNVSNGNLLTATTIDNVDKVKLELAAASAMGQISVAQGVDNTLPSVYVAQATDMDTVVASTYTDIVLGNAATSTDLTTGNAFFDYTWDSTATANGYELTVAYKTGVTSASTLADVVTGENNKAVAAIVDSGTNAFTDALFTDVFAQEDTDAALESISPDVSGGVQAAAVNTSVASTGTISNRLSSLRGIDNGRTGAVAGDHEMHANRGMWIQAFGTTADQDDRDGVAGFEATTGGMAIGVDSDDIMENTRLGVAFAYAVADVESDATNNAQTDIDTYQLSFYGSHDMSNGVYVDGMLSYAWNEHEAERTDFLGDTYEGDFDGTQWSVKAEVGKSYDWKNTKVTPNVGVHYINIETDDYSETGAGVNGQSVESDDVTALLLSVGSDIEWEMMSKDGSTYKPYLRAKYSYDTEADNAVTSATFLGGGSAFTSEGAEVEEHTITLGTGVNVMTAGGFEFTASYDADIKEDFLAHTGVLNARWAF